ncbi:hypothetical protein M409DRAFT_66843 [Zasmidium cellare ATCC 36951]|uniref:Aconitate hydratase, mitochondrial n=1 Tax=Zasmidium cellare ATCC 36951 TaxID=1080233 RepID=A0A6A6CJH3_ZASCE|nr:uncharacterized protein M409DRAFT_66843 [Zasmidium cellare ATCC 36951]KAF2165859.1 hypothetical protein M409DRAFT_66843 [Zasmidium cellare ATCC 36951]
MSRHDRDAFIDYARLDGNIRRVRDKLKRPLTYSEKVLYSHIDNIDEADIRRGDSYLKLRPARVACQDATAQMAMIQFMSAGLPKFAVPTTVHCDHLIVAKDGKDSDLTNAGEANKEVYDFLRSVCAKYGGGFWEPGAGIIHQTVLENYAYPGGLIIGTDSHTPNGGGLGMAAVGVGGADAVDVMSGLPWELKTPKVIGIRLTGTLSGWTAPKDIILKLAGLLTVKGGTGSIVEYFGPGVDSLSCTGMATICNMGAETGATTSIFPYTQTMGRYLQATSRSWIEEGLRPWQHNLRADEGAEYDQVLEIDLSSLEPHINGPSTPDLATPLSSFKEEREKSGQPNELSAGLVGSCTNSSFGDLSRASSLLQQAIDAGLKPRAPLMLSPGSENTKRTLGDAGILDVFENAGTTLLANACGPCCGSWDRTSVQKGSVNSVITSYNRNFTGRLDGNPATAIYVASPEMVVAKSIAGKLDFDPTIDSIPLPDGTDFKFQPPPAELLPPNGYVQADYVLTKPPVDPRQVEIALSPDSDRIQLLEPFRPWSGHDYEDLPILIKVEGKCTTDHITPAGPWFRYRGHLDNISNNTLIGAINAANKEVNTVQNVFTGRWDGVSATAREYKSRGQQWVVIADHNYGEGSSREHAALQPRFLNGVAIIARSFARIHETNLKKQGMLPLIFANPADYDRIDPKDRISLNGLASVGKGEPVTMLVVKENGEKWTIELQHTFNPEQYEFFVAGSALNLMNQRKG